MWDSVNNVYQLKEARKRNIETVRPLLKKAIHENKLDEEDDNDSGFSNGNGSIGSPDLSKNELATCLASASLKNPAHIKVKVIRNFDSFRPGTELSVLQGEVVNLLYKENDNVLVINSQGKRGFIPFSYCSLLHKKIPYTKDQFVPSQKSTHNPPTEIRNSSLHKHRTNMDVLNKNILPNNRHICTPNSKTRHGGSTSRNPKIFNRERPTISFSSEEYSDCYRGNSDYCREKSGYRSEKSEFPDKFTRNRKTHDSFHLRQKLKASYFRKGDERRMLVLYDFMARDENDISVYKGEVVLVLNRDDSDWWWVVVQDGYEGFAPRAYLARLSTVSSEGSTPCSTESFSSSSSTSEGSSTQAVRFQDPLCTFHRYEKEEWETDSELIQDHEQCGHPVVEAGEQETEHRDTDSRWSTWC